MAYVWLCKKPQCHAKVEAPTDVYDRAKETGEAIYCLAGHPNYVGKSQTKIDLERLQRDYARVRGALQGLVNTKDLQGDARPAPAEAKHAWQEARRVLRDVAP